jgi:hypothetical protein
MMRKNIPAIVNAGTPAGLIVPIIFPFNAAFGFSTDTGVERSDRCDLFNGFVHISFPLLGKYRVGKAPL